MIIFKFLVLLSNRFLNIIGLMKFVVRHFSGVDLLTALVEPCLSIYSV